MSDSKNNIISNLKDLSQRATNPEVSLRAIGFLFRGIAGQLGTIGDTTSEVAGEENLSRRLSSARHALQYFTLTPDPHVWSKSYVEEILQSEQPLEALLMAWRLIDASPESEKKKLRGDLLNALDSAFDKRLRLDERWFVAILSISAYYLGQEDRDEAAFYSFDNVDRIRWMLVKAWNALSVAEKERIFAFSMEAIFDFSMLCEFFRSIYGDITDSGAKRGDIPDDERAFHQAARERLLEVVRNIAQRSVIWSQADPASILWFWWGCGREEEVKAFTALAVKNFDYAVTLMKISIGFVLSTAGNYERVDINSWSRIYNVDNLKQIAEHMAGNEQSGHYSEAIAKRYLAALERSGDR